jgi:hypothetical protein
MTVTMQLGLGFVFAIFNEVVGVGIIINNNKCSVESLRCKGSDKK